MLPTDFKDCSPNIYFELCRSIVNKPRGKDLAIRNIYEDHNGFSPYRSYLKKFGALEPKYSENEISDLIIESVNFPSDYVFSEDGKFLLEKVFQTDIGIFRNRDNEEIRTSRFILVLNDLKSVYNSGGPPYNGNNGILLTGYPADPNGKFERKENRKFRKMKKSTSKSRSPKRKKEEKMSKKMQENDEYINMFE